MKASRECIRLIARFEGFRPTAYKIGSDPWTIGYGETQGVGPFTGPWTEAYARRRLLLRVNRDFAPAVDRWRRKHRLRWTQNQFDAIVSFAYNLGTGLFVDGQRDGLSLRGALKSGKASEVKKALLLYVMPGSQFEKGLRRRRLAEARLFARQDRRLARLRTELAQRRAQLRRTVDRERRAWLMRRIRSIKKAVRR